MESVPSASCRAGARKGVRHGHLRFQGEPTLSRHSYGAHFVEVTWQPEIARLRVARAVSVIDAGRILNPLASRNQIEGAVVMGVGMALLEETDYDPRSGAPVNASLADYLVATHADAPRMELYFLEYPDTSLNELGARVLAASAGPAMNGSVSCWSVAAMAVLRHAMP